MNPLKTFNSLDKHTKLSVIILLLGILIRFSIAFFVYPSGDSTWHLSVARFIARENNIPLFEPLGRPVFWAPPVFHLTAAFFYKVFSIFGEQIATKSMNFVSPLYGSLTLILFYFFLKDLIKDEKIRLYSLLFLTFIPIHIYYSTISHVDATIAFYALFSLYLLYKKRFILAAIFSGVGCLAKYSMFWMFPVFIFLIAYRNTIKQSIKKCIIFFLITFLIGLPWYIRNIIHLGNPFYYFLNSLFYKLGFSPFAYGVYGIRFFDFNILQMKYASAAYLDMFGVPLGLPQNLAHLNLPFMPLPLIVWFLFTFIFFFPLILGLFVKKKNDLQLFLWVWLISFFAMNIFYLLQEQQVYLRLSLPAMPALAVFWAFGLEKISRPLKNKNIKRVFVFLIICSIIIFSFGEVFKAVTAARIYKTYNNDFDWVKENIPANAEVCPQSTVLVYYLDRENCPFSDINETEADYYFESKLTYKLDPLPQDILDKNFELVYESPTTEVKIYKNTTKNT